MDDLRELEADIEEKLRLVYEMNEAKRRGEFVLLDDETRDRMKNGYLQRYVDHFTRQASLPGMDQLTGGQEFMNKLMEKKYLGGCVPPHSFRSSNSRLQTRLSKHAFANTFAVMRDCEWVAQKISAGLVPASKSGFPGSTLTLPSVCLEAQPALHKALHPAPCTVHTAHCTQHTAHCTLHPAICAALHTMHCNLHSHSL